jgi:hypothetical protein
MFVTGCKGSSRLPARSTVPRFYFAFEGYRSRGETLVRCCVNKGSLSSLDSLIVVPWTAKHSLHVSRVVFHV